MSNKSRKMYVAYGSNLNLDQMTYRCPDAQVLGSGVVKNHELTFWGTARRDCGVATILPRKGTDVPVGVFAISASDERNLDSYEGWPYLYRKEFITVELDSGKKVRGMVYLMNTGTVMRPSDYYYNTIKIGYEDFGFDTGFLDAAVKKAAKRVEDDDMSMYSFMRLIDD